MQCPNVRTTAKHDWRNLAYQAHLPEGSLQLEARANQTSISYISRASDVVLASMRTCGSICPLLQPPLLLAQAGLLLGPPLCRQIRVRRRLLLTHVACAAVLVQCKQPLRCLRLGRSDMLLRRQASLRLLPQLP